MKTLPDRLYCFDVANNHMGDLNHGKRIIHELARVHGVTRASIAIKLQYRDLDTFIHPNYAGAYSYKYVKRFSETRLSWDQLLALKEEMINYGFLTECTPFDEASVDKIEEHGYDILKIASCSFTDWPLLERIVQTDMPIIASTAGATLDDIDSVVSFFVHRNKELVLMHCVANYPTTTEQLQLNQIDLFQERYPGIRIGLSLHTAPDKYGAAWAAIGKGIRIFEKHVGLEDTQKGYKNNAYSSTPQQILFWVEEAEEATTMCGEEGKRTQFFEKDTADLRTLQRGVWSTATIPPGERIYRENILLAIPTQPGQLTANDWSKYSEFYAETGIPANSPILLTQVQKLDHQDKISEITEKVKDLITQSGILVPSRLDLEISHHYGIDRFYEYGCVLINFINRSYCKKLIIVLGGQKHPTQYHLKKDETFNLLYGDLTVQLGEAVFKMEPGETVDVDPEVRHTFWSNNGAIIEEISTTHFVDDSYYIDPTIMENKNRKTGVTHWLGK